MIYYVERNLKHLKSIVSVSVFGVCNTITIHYCKLRVASHLVYYLAYFTLQDNNYI